MDKSKNKYTSSEKPSQRNVEEMANVLHKTKQLYLDVKDNEESYSKDENLDMQAELEKTEDLYSTLILNKPTAQEYVYDSNLLLLQTKIIRQNAKSYKLFTRTFDPVKFSKHTRNYFGLGQYNENLRNSDQKALSTLWSKLGEYSKEIMYTVPTFNFLYGTFDPDPVEPVTKKKRKNYSKEKLGTVIKPALVSIDSVDASQDVMCKDAARLLSYFMKCLDKSEKRSICFYEFVVDPTSFTRTVEYVFLVSLLVQHGELSLFEDKDGLPFLKRVESKHSEKWSKIAKQSALTISMEEYQKLIKTFGFKKPIILPKKD